MIPDDVMAVVDELSRRWGLGELVALKGATCAFVGATGDERVLKVPFAHAEEKDAYPTFRAFSAHGGVEVLAVDEASGAVLMPRLRPGITLDEFDAPPDRLVEICAGVILRFRETTFRGGIPLRAWMRELYTASDSDPFVMEAREVADHLFATTTQETLLHGDFHHGNILRHGDTWVGIDPKGVVGDPAFEITGFMRNPVGRVPGPEGQRRRLELFAEILGDPIERLWGWAFVQTVVSHIWCEMSPEVKAAWGKAAGDIWALGPGR